MPPFHGPGVAPHWPTAHILTATLAVTRRVPRDVNPFIANTVSMAVGTTVILTALGPLPGFHR